MIPTPTPLPPVATIPSLGFEGGNYVQDFAYTSVQLWNRMPDDGITAIQVFFILTIILLGVGLIIRGVRSLDAEA